MVPIVDTFPKFDINFACILPDQRSEIAEATGGVSVAARQRDGWACKQLTMVGNEETMDFALAKKMSQAAIQMNFDAGIANRSQYDDVASRCVHLRQKQGAKTQSSRPVANQPQQASRKQRCSNSRTSQLCRPSMAIICLARALIKGNEAQIKE